MNQNIRPALVVIDMEKAFLEEDSPLYIKQAKATLPACKTVVEEARKMGIPVFFVNRIYRKNGSDVEFCRYEHWQAGGRCLAPGSTGACSIEVPLELVPQEGDYTLIKPRFSAFFQTELDLIFRRLGIDTIFLAGTTTPNCIRTTCYDGLSLDYNVVIFADCCSSRSEAVQQANMEDMAFIGAKVVSGVDFLAEGMPMENTVGQVREKVMQDKTAPETYENLTREE